MSHEGEKDFGSHTIDDEGRIRGNYISSQGATSTAQIDQALIQSDGGMEFTGGFADRTDGLTGESLGSNVQYTQAQATAGQWQRFGFSRARQEANDVEYWGETGVGFDQAKGLFGGLQMPHGVTDLFDFEDTSFGAAASQNIIDTYGIDYSAGNGSYDLSQCRTGDWVNVRFSFNVVPQVANTTLQVGLIWATRDENDDVTFVFPLTTQPIFYGTGTQGQASLNRIQMTAYLASDQDINARALPAIKADNEILIQPLTTLITIVR